ncbi:hypothetical protein MTO96_011238 [Rhipicephalus appendiculatus]
MKHSSPEMPLSSSGIQSTSSEAVQAGLAVPGEEASGGGIEPASPRSMSEPILLRRSTRARKPPDRFQLGGEEVIYRGLSGPRTEESADNTRLHPLLRRMLGPRAMVLKPRQQPRQETFSF